MELIALFLAVLAIAAGGAAVWLGLGRARLAAEVVREQAARAASEGEAVRLRTEVGEVRSRAEADAERLRGRIEELSAQATELQVETTRLGQQIAAADELHRRELQKHEEVYRGRLSALEEQKAAMDAHYRTRLEELNGKFRDEFDALAGKALKFANEEFMKRAEERFSAERQKTASEMELKKAAVDELIKPISDTLEKTGVKLAEIDKARVESVSQLTEHLRSVAEGNQSLREETARLVQALREPHVRGRYGELQLRRVAELAGMTAYCDFCEQDATVDSEGRALKPDMVVRLPSGRVVVVDAKTNIQAYLDALQAPGPAEAEPHLDRFARHVAEQAMALARKKYWAQYDGSPEFTVMFIPGDHFIDAALARQPELLETAARQRVLLAGPATLIGLLRAVAVGYREQRLAEAAAELRTLGIEFHDRACTAFAHVSQLGSALNSAVDKYNAFVGSYERRLEPTLRKFGEAGAGSGKQLPAVSDVEARARVNEVKSDVREQLTNGPAAP